MRPRSLPVTAASLSEVPRTPVDDEQVAGAGMAPSSPPVTGTPPTPTAAASSPAAAGSPSAQRPRQRSSPRSNRSVPEGAPPRVSPPTRRTTPKSAMYASEPVVARGAVPDRRGVGVGRARDKMSPVSVGGAVAVGFAKSRLQSHSSSASDGAGDAHPALPAVFLSWADPSSPARGVVVPVSMPAVPASAQRVPVQSRSPTAAGGHGIAASGLGAAAGRGARSASASDVVVDDLDHQDATGSLGPLPAPHRPQ
jgi:hypothetical protein